MFMYTPCMLYTYTYIHIQTQKWAKYGKLGHLERVEENYFVEGL